jgi:hypothetical protein
MRLHTNQSYLFDHHIPLPDLRFCFDHAAFQFPALPQQATAIFVCGRAKVVSRLFIVSFPTERARSWQPLGALFVFQAFAALRFIEIILMGRNPGAYFSFQFLPGLAGNPAAF